MSDLIDRIKKNSTIKETNILSESKLFSTKDLIQTAVPALNVALSGKLDGGLTPGLTIFAGPSKHFKTAFAMMLVKSFLDKYDDGVVLFYDSEFGAPQSYFENFGIDTNKVIHTPITDIEQLKHDIMKQVNELERKDRVMIVVDSVGNLASKKEVDDALDGKSVADMTRAKQMKSLFRMITPHLTIKDIPMVVVRASTTPLITSSSSVVSRKRLELRLLVTTLSSTLRSLVTFVRSQRSQLKLPSKVVSVSGLVYLTWRLSLVTWLNRVMVGISELMKKRSIA
jgi:RecA/RadA recombinase